MRTRLTLCLAIAAVVSVGAGCGGDDENSDQEAITAVLAQLRDAQDSGDAETACADVYVIQEGQRRAGELAGRGRRRAGVESEEVRESEEAAEAESEERRGGREPRRMRGGLRGRVRATPGGDQGPDDHGRLRSRSTAIAQPRSFTPSFSGRTEARSARTCRTTWCGRPTGGVYGLRTRDKPRGQEASA